MNPRLFSLQPGADAIKKLGALLVLGACGLFCPLSGSAAAPSQPDALTAASFSSDFPTEHMPLKVGVVKYVRPSPYEPIVEATIGALKRVFGTANVIVTHYDLAGLSFPLKLWFLRPHGALRRPRSGHRCVKQLSQSQSQRWFNDRRVCRPEVSQ